MVTVIKMYFSLRQINRLYLCRQPLHRQPALRKPRGFPPLTRSARISPSSLSSSPTSSAGNTTPWPSSLPSCCNFSARLRHCAFSRSPLSVSMRMSGAKLPGWLYRLDTRGVGLYRRQPVAVPSVPRHLRFTRQRHPPRQVTLPPPDPFCHSPSQRVVEVAALYEWLLMLSAVGKTPGGAGCRSGSGGSARRPSVSHPSGCGPSSPSACRIHRTGTGSARLR